MTGVKLCGLRRAEDIRAANALRPDYVGFVFAPKSRRYVTCEEAAALRSALDADIPAVGVFVNEDMDLILRLLDRGVIQIAQLHGQEDEAYIRELRARSGRPVWKAFRVDGPEDLARAAASGADMVLLDNGPGGTGERFDWELLRGFDARPYILAGGLHPGNAARAAAELAPFALDVSSGVETDGKKDPEKMRLFVQAVREVNT